MKKFLFILIGVMALVACNDQNAPHLKNFQVVMDPQYLHDHSAGVQIIPADKEKYYFSSFMTAKEFFNTKPSEIVQQLKEATEGLYPDLLYHGDQTFGLGNLLSGTDYVYFLFYVDEQYNMVGELEYYPFTTTGQKPVSKTTANFTFTVFNFDTEKKSFDFTIEPKDDKMLYWWDITTKSVVDETGIDLNPSGPIQPWTTTPDNITSGPFSHTSAFEVQPDTEYVIMAVKAKKEPGSYVADGYLESLVFRTPKAK